MDPQFPYEIRAPRYQRALATLDEALTAARSMITIVAADPRDEDGARIPIRDDDYCLDYAVTVYGPESPRWGIKRIRWDVLRQKLREDDLILARTFLTMLEATDSRSPVALRADVRGTLTPGSTLSVTLVRDFYIRAGYPIARARKAAKADIAEFAAQGLIYPIQRGWYAVHGEPQKP